VFALRAATHTFASIVVWNAMLGNRALIARVEEFCRSISNAAMVVVGPGTFESFPQGIQAFSEA
jgi:hypothetical protein